METDCTTPKQHPTRAQLVRGAAGISYRAEQLGGAVSLWTKFDEPPFSGWLMNVINNCRIESALVHARALSGFLMAKPGGDRYLHHSHYRSWSWPGQASDVTGRIFGAVSNHLAHPSLGDVGEEPHPGEWPLPELAQVLLGGLVRFVNYESAVTETYDPAWFIPSPVLSFVGLMKSADILGSTVVSDHPEVGSLTRSLQDYITEQSQGVTAVPEG